MRKLLAIIVLGLFLGGCGINQSALNIGTSFAEYKSACRKAAIASPKLVYNDGKIKGYQCEDGTPAHTTRYEFFEKDRLVRVWSKPLTAAERAARLNAALLGLAIINSGNPGSTTSQNNGMYSFDIPSGMNRVCFYDQLGSLNSMTIGRTESCPLN